jgi:amino acid adenylation domain-containing protein/non-ribosomal peptide synthase protein (TIGR01720 family)
VSKLVIAANQKSKEREYWLNKLSGELVKSTFPYDNNSMPTKFNMQAVRFSFSREIYSKLMTLSNGSYHKIHMILTAGLTALLYKYTNNQDIIIGTPIYKQKLKGDFINTILVLRNQLESQTTFKQLLLNIRQTLFEAMENQNYPIEILSDHLNMPVSRDNDSQLFDVAILLENIHDKNYLQGINFSLLFSFLITGKCVGGILEYHPVRYKKNTILRIIDHFTHLLQKVLFNLDLMLSQLSILSDAEKQRILFQLNNTKKYIERDKCYHQLFQKQVTKTPDRIGVVHKSKCLTYRRLDEKANQLGNYLFSGKKIEPGDRIGVLMDRSIDFLAAILGILKSGASYVPLESSLPEERIKNMIIDADIGVVISQSKYIRILNRLQWECTQFHTFICVDSPDVYSEDVIEENELIHQKDIWEYVGKTASDEIEGGGWISSYTGFHLSKEEMEEYGDNILKKLTKFLHKEMKVLEIGCASGITMFKIAPKVKLYHGVDISRIIIQKNKERVKKEGYKNIVLNCLAAHEIDQLNVRNFDLIIMNSVIQSFHGHNYLRKVIGEAINLVRNKGFMFIGDIMDQDLKENLIHELFEFKRTNSDKNYRTKTDFSMDLFVSQAFFENLAIELPEIAEVEFTDKIYTIENELTKYRFDTLIKIDKASKNTGNSKQKCRYQDDLRTLKKYSLDKPVSQTTPNSLAYIIYTSGTTGQPKGVMIHHLGMLNHLYAKINDLSIMKVDIIAQTASASFDISLWQFLAGLLVGGCTLIIDREIILEPTRLLRILQNGKITILESVPSLMTAFLKVLADEGNRELKNLRWMIFTGETLSVPLVREWYEYYPNIKILNAYGPTEASDDITHHVANEIIRYHQETIPIGKPLQNLHIYILDKNMSLCPIGVRGEICVAGMGVGKGYWKDHEKTKKAFLPNPYIDEIGDNDYSTLYKTGDIGYFKEDGNVECLGRMDYQVKIRGNRIELGEIENQLLQHIDIRNAVVVVKESTEINTSCSSPGASTGEKQGDKYLCAYIVSDRELEISELREYLSQKLPIYMIPSYYVKLKDIPLTRNGKVDRKRLPEPEADRGIIAPIDETEEKLVKLWTEVLGIEKKKISVNADFFELGGHSLKATVLNTKIHKAFSVNVPLAELFKNSTVRGIAKYIKSAAEDKYLSIKHVEEKEYYALSSAQKRLYILQQMELEGTAYNISQVMVVEGILEKEAFQQSFQKLIKQHENLRTSFKMIGEEPVQRINREIEFKIQYYKVDINCKNKVEEIINNFITPFDLTQAPLFRVGLAHLNTSPLWESLSPTAPSTQQRGGSSSRYIFMVDMHHIISDGVSHTILVRDFMNIYKGEELRKLRIQYKDFSKWENSQKEKEKKKQSAEYWLGLLRDELPLLNLPIDYDRSVVQNFEGSTVIFEMGSNELKALKKLVKKEKTTFYVVLLAAFNVLLSKISGQEDIIVGTAVANRGHADLENVIGMFVNTLVLRNFPKGEKTFAAFMGETEKRSLEAFENQDYPFEELVNNVSTYRDVSRNPIFDVVFVLQNMDFPEAKIPGLRLMPYEYKYNKSKFDLTLIAVEAPDKLLLNFEYCTKLFKNRTIERFIFYYKKILTSILDNPNKRISQIEIIPEEEKKQILFDFNDTRADYPNHKTIQQLFTDQVQKTADHVALVAHCAVREAQDKKGCSALGDLRNAITYKELNEKASQLAGLLEEIGVRPDTIVGIMVERSIEMITGILGILKAGGAYLPIEPEYPEKRINYMLTDSSASVLVTKRKEVEKRSGINEKIVKGRLSIVNCQWEGVIGNRLAGSPKKITPRNPQPAVNPSNLAYIIYTSGTTGKPKGVLITHRNVARLLVNNRFQFDFNSSDTWSLFHSYSFDFSVWEMYGALLYGGKLRLIPRMTAVDTQEFLEILAKENITVLNQTPSVFYNLANLEVQNPNKHLYLKYVIFGGEALKPIKLQQWKNKYPQTRFINMFGITETTVHVTYKEVEIRDMQLNRSNIGRPIPTLYTYIMDGDQRLLPIGIPGEICVGGEGVARGYLNRPQLTSEKFVNHPYIPGQRLYRSGDLGRLLENGDIEYLGRIDHQVKIRGHRIELGEIESQLLRSPDVKEVLVLTKGELSGDKYLCAYVVLNNTESLNQSSLVISKLRKQLLQSLPDYMIPAYFIPIEKIPLTPNGKVDRKALPGPGQGPAKKYTTPRSRIEEKLVTIWQEILGDRLNTDVGIDDNFFEVGGHSLKAATLASRIHKELDTQVPLTKIFTHQTIRKLSHYIEGAEKDKFAAIEPVEKREYYVLSSAQKRLYILQQMELTGKAYSIPQAVSLAGELDIERLKHTFKQLIQRHESLRTSFVLVSEEPMQRIHDKVQFEIEWYELDKKQEAISKRKERMPGSIINNFIRPFDLTRAPLLRVGLIPIESNKYLLMADMHHIISDGISSTVLIRDFIALYKREEIPQLKLQYHDYSQWQNSNEQQKALEKKKDYWLKTFTGEIPVLKIHSDYPRPQVQSFAGNTVNFEIDKETTKSLYQLAGEGNTTLYTVLLAVFNVILAKITSQEDIIIGTPAAGRKHADLEQVIGMFVNTLGLRNFPNGEMTFMDFLHNVKENTLEAFDNQDYPFEELVEKVPVNRDVSRNPLFDIMFILQNIDFPRVELPSLTLTSYKYTNKVSKFDMTLYAVEIEEKLILDFEYCTALFKQETIESFISFYIAIIYSILHDPYKRISGIDIMTGEEKKQILIDFNDTDAEFPQDKTIHELFEEQVEHNPDNVALGGPKLQIKNGKAVSITYRVLNEKSGQLAHLLKQQAIGLDTIVGIMAERSPEMLIGILAILKAGGAYLPIEPDYPEERINYMLTDSNAKILLAPPEAEFEVKIGQPDGQHLQIINMEKLTSPSTLTSTCQVSSANLAYIIYTSGTTGKPKGTPIRHCNASNYVTWFKREFQIGVDDRFCFTGSFCFDMSVTALIVPLISGASIYTTREKIEQDPQVYTRFLAENRISIVKLTPTQFRPLQDFIQDEDLASLRYIILGGEAVDLKDIQHYLSIYKQQRIVNEYGPTEATVATVFHVVSGNDFENTPCYGATQSSLPIGWPVSNTRIYILDKYTSLVPPGVVGELCIDGESVALGYVNKPELTAEKFCRKNFLLPTHPTHLLTHSPIYRTGDLARWLPDGNIECLGREDHQVKVRGFRIELGEIEYQLLMHPDIREAVVAAKKNDKGDMYLCAYYVSGRTFTASDFRAYLSKQLPGYMIPVFFVPLLEIPLTPAGKIDRRGLPQPEANASEDYEAPFSDIQKKLAAVWQEVLGIEKIGINDEFFEMGGDSIKAIQISSRLMKYKLKLEIRDLFTYPRIKLLEKCIQPLELMVDQGVVQGEVPLTPIQAWFFENNRVGRHHFNQSVMLYHSQGFETETLKKIFNKILCHHDALRMVYEIRGDRIIQENRGVEERLFDVEVIDITGNHRSEIQKRIETACAGIQGSIDLEKGPLVKLGLFKTGIGDYLLIAVHHLVIDGVSWRILLEDLDDLYQQVAKGEELKLPFKTTSFKEWAEKLVEYSTCKEFLAEISYWQEVENIPLSLLPKDRIAAERNGRDNTAASFTLSARYTEKLLTEMHRAYNTHINDILLVSLGMALNKWAGLSTAVVELEGHGREDIIKNTNVSRTVGWFTSLYPVVLDMKHTHNLSNLIIAAKETLRNIPGKGIGYGILKYLTPLDKREGLEFRLEPEISFNYLGQFDRDVKRDSFRIADISAGRSYSLSTERIYTFDIVGMVLEGKLKMSVRYSKQEYDEETILAFVQAYEKSLQQIIDHCMAKEETQLTLSDLSLEDFNEREVAAVFDELEEAFGS